MSPEAARLFYDPRCGPCALFARVSARLGGSRLRSLPYDEAEATRDLGDLDEETRFAYAHLVDDRGRSSGSALMPPLVKICLGETAGRLVLQVAPLDRALRWTYDQFWNYRRTRGCAATSAVPDGFAP